MHVNHRRGETRSTLGRRAEAHERAQLRRWYKFDWYDPAKVRAGKEPLAGDGSPRHWPGRRGRRRRPWAIESRLTFTIAGEMQLHFGVQDPPTWRSYRRYRTRRDRDRALEALAAKEGRSCWPRFEYRAA